MQSIAPYRILDEQQMQLNSASDTNRQSSAVTLIGGDVILTGGTNRGREVFRITNLGGIGGHQSIRLSDMVISRYGHASATIQLQSECVIVAGGYNKQGQVQASVELFSFVSGVWTPLDDLPKPRVYFSLQVVDPHHR